MIKRHNTNPKNPATIQYISGSLHLKIHSGFDNNPSLQHEYLRELIHELGALLLLQSQAKIHNMAISNSNILQIYKNNLVLDKTNVALTHFVDAVLSSLIQDKTK